MCTVKLALPRFHCRGGPARTGFQAGSEGHRWLLLCPPLDAAPSIASPHPVNFAPFAMHQCWPPQSPTPSVPPPPLCSRPAPCPNCPFPFLKGKFHSSSEGRCMSPPPGSPLFCAPVGVSRSLQAPDDNDLFLCLLSPSDDDCPVAWDCDLFLNHRCLARYWHMVDIHESPSKE